VGFVCVIVFYTVWLFVTGEESWVNPNPSTSNRDTCSSCPSSWIFLCRGSRDSASATDIIPDFSGLYWMLKFDSESCSSFLASRPELIFESSSISRLRWSEVTVNLMPAR
jgi:hypothetical protein